MSDPVNIADEQTTSADVKWVVEVYPFATALPTEEQGGGVAAGAASIIGSQSLGSAIANGALSGLDALTGGKEADGLELKDRLSLGLTSISIARTKASPAAQASFAVAGPLPAGVYTGSWVIISTVSATNEPDKPKVLTRFIGQISQVQSQYAVQENNLLTSRHNVTLREWSFALASPVEFHRYSVIRETVASAGGLGAADVLGAINAVSGGSLGALDKLQDIISKSFDPLELAQAVLLFIGSIEEADYFENADSTKKLKGDGLDSIPSFATTMPSVPEGVIKRLGLPVSKPETPFTSGFVKVVTGSIPPGGINSSGDWDGIFTTPGVAAPSATEGSFLDAIGSAVGASVSTTGGITIDDYAKKIKEYYENTVKDTRPSIQGVAALAELSYSVWEMLNNYADSAFNEFYTDMWYQKSANGEVIGRPVLVCRNKPFLLKQFIEPENDEFSSKLSKTIRVPDIADTWSKFDDIPRVRVPSSLVRSIGFNNTAIDSPNYLQVSINPALFTKGLEIDGAGVASIVRKGPEINRFGGKTTRIPSSFMAIDAKATGFDFVSWFTTLSDVFGAWYSYGYRSAQGSMSLKDNNIPISIGFNVQLTAGKNQLVMHVEGYSIAFQVNAAGLETTDTNIQFTRLTKVGESGKLEFLEPDEFGNLFRANPPSLPENESYLDSSLPFDPTGFTV